MAVGLSKALRRFSLGMDFIDCYDDEQKITFTLGTSNIKCVKTREATNEIGGFAQFVYIAEDNLMVVDRTHRFSLRRDKKEITNCFVSTTEIYVALTKVYDEMMDTDTDILEEYQCITFSETEDPRVVAKGDALFTEPPDIFQISAECRLRGDRVEMTNVHVLHTSLFELNNLY
tara:strand:- start:784 stop:1305 length:522 start_codon:yes stop_codon:yes gene_type:complete